MAATAVRPWRWIALVAGIAVLVFAAILVVPILTHENQGLSGQGAAEEPFPLTVTAVGDDGRTRSLAVASDPGDLDTSALAEGDRIVVSGSGYDAARGVCVAICVIPDDPSTKPGPCLGGVPSQDEQEQVEAGTVQYAPSNWINDDWAWRLFGARSFDDVETGAFTAYLEVPSPVGEGVDCRSDACGIFTRNDHTALTDRVQDVHVPVAFAP